MNKNFYEKPTVDLLVIRFEENYCGTNLINPNGSESGNARGGEDEEDYYFS